MSQELHQRYYCNVFGSNQEAGILWYAPEAACGNFKGLLLLGRKQDQTVEPTHNSGELLVREIDRG